MRNFAKTTLMILSIFSLNACAEFGWNPLDPTYVPPEEMQTVPNVENLRFDLLVFEGHTAKLVESELTDPHPITQRRFTWRGDDNFTPQAEIISWHSQSTKPLPDIADPKQFKDWFSVFRNKKLRYLDYFQTYNSLGKVLWRRIAYGPAICLIFQQDWNDVLLTGYYCAADADPLSAGQGETIIQSIKVN